VRHAGARRLYQLPETVCETALAASRNAASVVGDVDMQTGLPGCDAIDRPVASLDQGIVRRSAR
jgi:hypothetical protein